MQPVPLQVIDSRWSGHLLRQCILPLPLPVNVIDSGCWAIVEKGLILEVEDHHPHHVVLPAWGGVVG